VRLETPNINDVGTWQGAFISSTSRLLLPVDHIAVFSQEGPPGAAMKEDGLYSFPFSEASLAQQHADTELMDSIEQLVMDKILDNSEKVL
jgi:hypothetical protein